MPADSFQGRFAGLLPPKPSDEKTRHMGRMLLDAMGVKSPGSRVRAGGDLALFPPSMDRRHLPLVTARTRGELRGSSKLPPCKFQGLPTPSPCL
jgi:hypothetical protein